MSLDLSAFVERKHWFRAYERRELRFIHTVLHPGDCFVDVGANVGVLTLEAAAAVGQRGRVIAVEPVPANVVRLRRNVALQRCCVVVVETAVGASAGTLRLGIADTQREIGNSGSYSSSTEGHTSVEVPVVRLDDLIERELDAGERIALVKIDVEGMEADVLRGGAAALSSGRVRTVMYESNPSLGDSTPEELLTAYGFEIRRLRAGARPARIREPRRRTSAPLRTGTIGGIIDWISGRTRLETIVALRGDD